MSGPFGTGYGGRGPKPKKRGPPKKEYLIIYQGVRYSLEIACEIALVHPMTVKKSANYHNFSMQDAFDKCVANKRKREVIAQGKLPVAPYKVWGEE